MDKSSRPAMMLVGGRTVGLAATFAIGIILARHFDQAVFGVYKQFFLVFATLYGVLQLGMAESLYYFVPRAPERTGRYVANAVVALLAVGGLCTLALYLARPALAGWMNEELASYALPLGLFLTFSLASTVLEIVMVSRKQHMRAAVTYAISDFAKTALFIAPALLIGSLTAVFWGATLFAALRMAATLVILGRQWGREFRVDAALLREQLTYAVPFAIAVGIEVILINYHQYVVASSFTAATFAIYAVGCMQIPLYDLIIGSTVNVLMVRMADAPRGREALALWHDTITRLAFLMFPLTALLVASASDLIIGLFTQTYAASIPIFIVWVLTMVPGVLAVDAVLRVYAQTRFLLIMNVVRFVCVAGLITAFLSSFGLTGAVLVTLVAVVVTKVLGAARIASLMGVGVREALPWRRLAVMAALSLISLLPLYWLQVSVEWPALARFVVGTGIYVATYLGLTWLGAQVLRDSGALVPVQRFRRSKVHGAFTGTSAPAAPVAPVNGHPGTPAPEHLSTAFEG
jgi:O-antigen/teichoic acid export membrane protein